MDKLLAIAGIGRILYAKWLLGRLISSVITLIVLAVITLVMASVMLVSCIYAFYLTLVIYGIAAYTALIATTGLVIMLTLLFLILTIRYYNHLRAMPQRLLREKSPLTSKAGEMMDAFMKGLQTPSR